MIPALRIFDPRPASTAVWQPSPIACVEDAVARPDIRQIGHQDNTTVRLAPRVPMHYHRR